MYCENCGNRLDANGVCPGCGRRRNPQASFNQPGSLPSDIQPLSPWAYIGYNILFALPLVGIILIIVFAVSKTNNVNLRNYARAYLYIYLIAIALFIIIAIIASMGLGVASRY